MHFVKYMALKFTQSLYKVMYFGQSGVFVKCKTLHITAKLQVIQPLLVGIYYIK